MYLVYSQKGKHTIKTESSGKRCLNLKKNVKNFKKFVTKWVKMLSYIVGTKNKKNKGEKNEPFSNFRESSRILKKNL